MLQYEMHSAVNITCACDYVPMKTIKAVMQL